MSREHLNYGVGVNAGDPGGTRGSISPEIQIDDRFSWPTLQDVIDDGTNVALIYFEARASNGTNPLARFIPNISEGGAPLVHQEVSVATPPKFALVDDVTYFYAIVKGHYVHLEAYDALTPVNSMGTGSEERNDILETWRFTCDEVFIDIAANATAPAGAWDPLNPNDNRSFWVLLGKVDVTDPDHPLVESYMHSDIWPIIHDEFAVTENTTGYNPGYPDSTRGYIPPFHPIPLPGGMFTNFQLGYVIGEASQDGAQDPAFMFKRYEPTIGGNLMSNPLAVLPITPGVHNYYWLKVNYSQDIYRFETTYEMQLSSNPTYQTGQFLQQLNYRIGSSDVIEIVKGDAIATNPGDELLIKYYPIAHINAIVVPFDPVGNIDSYPHGLVDVRRPMILGMAGGGGTHTPTT